ncbi:MAG: peroxiredoxin [Pseudomonadota bacterium]
MAISIGDKLPEAKFMVMGDEGPAPKTTAEIFGGRKVALFAVPGAFTPTCHQQHMPGFLANLDKLSDKGVDAVVCTAVNDIFVLTNWAEATGATGKVEMIADGNAEFVKAIGLEIDLSGFGLNTRSKRYSMLVDDGVVKILNIDEAPPVHDKSSAETLCSMVGDTV